ncbi:peptidase M6 [Tepidibacillus marianensis]|uniref:peptidase M6 n=1 Tax=Tepidibacillus marianensis TaxID=3131995 RepID=UPI0030D5764F
MRKKILSLAVIFALMVSIVLPASFAKATTPTKDPYNTARYGDTIDIGPQIRAMDKDGTVKAKLDAKLKEDAQKIHLDGEAATTSTDSSSAFTYDGGTKYFLGYDTVNGYYFKKYTLRSVGDKVEVWVANDLAFLPGDTRPAHVVTQEQVDQLTKEFDNNIYKVDTEFFGTPDSHTGENATLPGMVGLPQDYYTPTDGKERAMMLVDNFRDENYYDPTYPFYVAGFYSGSYEQYFDRNIINIDTNRWDVNIPNNSIYGTIAHEFQHLIHADNDSAEETWINEGMSDFAEYLAGYGQPWGHINYFLDHPENSLVSWDEYVAAGMAPETLADYGQAYLLQLYLDDHYGKDFIKRLATDKDHGITSVNKILKEFSTGIDFTELFKRFSIALAIDSAQPGNGMYQFKSIDVNVNFQNALLNDKDGVPAWGGDYKLLNNTDKIRTINFDGINFMPIPWKIVSDPMGLSQQVLWGNQGDEADNQLVLPVDLMNVPAATLQFDHFLSIEEQWDFGVVQVSTDNGQTWKSLANKNTRSDLVPEGHPTIAANLPGFTGYTDDWITEKFDLTPYAGKQILVNFRYLTDWGYNDAGWFIKNVQIPEIHLVNAGDTLDGFKSIDEIKGDSVKYAVTFINEKTLGNGKKDTLYRVHNVNPFDVTEEDALQLRQLFKEGKNYMIVWYAAPIDKKGSVDYSYEIINKSMKTKMKTTTKTTTTTKAKNGK